MTVYSYKMHNKPYFSQTGVDLSSKHCIGSVYGTGG